MLMTIDPTRPRIEADTNEVPRPRSMALALHRLGFARRPDCDPVPRWPRTWSRRERDDAALDWRPL